MGLGTEALSLLGESADWLKDSDGVSLSEYRLRAVQRLASYWRHPDDASRLEKFEEALVILFQGLFFNKLYPDNLFFVHESPADPRNFLVRADHLAEDVPRLADFCVANRLGVGELHALHLTTLLCRRAFVDPKAEEDMRIEALVADWLFLRKPELKSKNAGDFSDEARQLFRALRGFRVMQEYGLADNANASRLSVADRMRTLDRLGDVGTEGMAQHCGRDHALAMAVLELSTAMELRATATAAGGTSKDSRNSKALARGLLRCMGRVAVADDTSLPRRARLADLLLSALVRAMPRVEPAVAVMIYAKLRARTGRRPHVSHEAMFSALPNDEGRLQLLNFLYREGTQNPFYYVNRFAGCFEHGELRFESKETGFRLKPSA